MFDKLTYDITDMEVGDTLRYTIRVSNDGPTSESLVVVEDNLPPTAPANVAWQPDGSLGCPQPGMAYTQALVNGSMGRISGRAPASRTAGR